MMRGRTHFRFVQFNQGELESTAVIRVMIDSQLLFIEYVSRLLLK